MHDDIPLTVGRARRVLTERIWPAVYSEAVPLDVAAAALPGEPVPPSEGFALEYAPVEVGTPWGPAWSTTWFRVRGVVPEAWAGRRVELVADLGFDPAMTGFQCEALVYRADGTAVKSLNPRSQWVLVADPAQGGDPVELYLEAAANPVLLDYQPFRPTREGDVRTSSTRPLYTTRRMDLAVLDPQVHALALDVEVLLELQDELAAAPRRMRILQALDDALDALDLQDVAGSARAARAELAEVLAAPAEASAHTVSAIGHAHIDSAWLWPVRETIRKVARTVSSMTALIDETEDFCFGMSSAQQYAWVRDHRPEVWKRLVEAVAAGRFVPLGGMWVESDTVMPSGESLVRQLLYGQRFFAEEFGIRCSGVWLPDSFGYSPALPQLIRRSGMSWFFTQKISWNQVNVFPHHTFEWEGIDGSRVLTHFPPMDTYNAQLSGAEMAKASRQFRESRVAGGSIAPVGWGDGGGGTTREMVGRAQRLRSLEGSPVVRWEHPDAFFARTREELHDPAVWVGELYLELHRATLTSQHRTKAGNRRSEHLLVEAELWAATAAVRVGARYPRDEIDDLWRRTLLLQFHDILPGTSIAWVHREAVEEHDRIQEAAQRIITGSLDVLVGEGDRALVANGSTCTVGGATPGAVVPAPARGASASLTPLAPTSGWVLANEHVRITVGPNGHVLSALDLVTGRDAVAPGAEANVLHLHQDFPNMWDAWDVDRFYKNRYRVLDDVQQVETGSGPDGEVTLTVHRAFGASVVRQTLSLAPGSRTLRVHLDAEWHEVEKFLKVAFPLDVRADQTLAETQFGYQRRPTHTNTSWDAARFETSMHRFVLVEEPGFGVALVNDSSYGFDVTREAVDAHVTTTLRLSLLRAPRFPDPETDQGHQELTYGLVIGADLATATAEGAVLSSPPRTVLGAREVEPLVTVTDDTPEGSLIVSAVKLAADGSGDLVVRVYESLGRRVSGSVTIQADVAHVSRVGLLEDPVDDEPGDLPNIDGAPGVVPVRLGPFEICTLRVALAAAPSQSSPR